MPTKRAAIADAHAPSVSLPLRFILTGIAALLAGAGWLALRPIILAGYHYSPQVVAVTHLFVLGWVGSVVMGAMYQLVPVALETQLHSERLARWHFALQPQSRRGSGRATGLRLTSVKGLIARPA